MSDKNGKTAFDELKESFGKVKEKMRLIEITENNSNCEDKLEKTLLGISKIDAIIAFFNSLIENDTIDAVDAEIEQLKRKNEELRYRPGNPGYVEAENEFTSLAKEKMME